MHWKRGDERTGFWADETIDGAGEKGRERENVKQNKQTKNDKKKTHTHTHKKKNRTDT
jgi:hypothetical protein